MLFAKALLFAGLLVPAFAAPSLAPEASVRATTVSSADVVKAAIAVNNGMTKVTDKLAALTAAATPGSAAITRANTGVQNLKKVVMPVNGKLTTGNSTVVGNPKVNGLLGASIAANKAVVGNLVPGQPLANALNKFTNANYGGGDDDGSDIFDLYDLIYGLGIVLSDLVNAILYLLLALVALVNDCPYEFIYDLFYAIFELLQAIAELVSLALSYGAGSYSDEVIYAINAAM